MLCVVRCAKNAAQRPKNNAIPSGLSEKDVYGVESLRFGRYGGNFIFEGGRVDGTQPLNKVLILVQRPQHKGTSDSVRPPQKNHFGAILIEFGDTKKCHTFRGLELVLIS